MDWAELIFTPGVWQFLLCFIACSFLMIFRLNAIEKNGFEGTLIGTLVMPYFSGFPNLCFAYLMAKAGSLGSIVLENCLVNNITNLTIVLALPALFWGLNLYKNKTRPEGESKINHLSLLLSILALIFFSAAVFVLSLDEKLNSTDGLILVGIFLFWQLFHLFDVMKNNTRKDIRIKKRILVDLFIISIAAWGIFSSVDGLIDWINQNGNNASSSRFFSKSNLGFLSGMLMVLPNAVLAFYYSLFKRSEIAYSSQIGDCHICIPLCVGIFAVFSPISVPASFQTALIILMGAACFHFLFILFLGRLPRVAGMILTCLYAFFIYKEVI